MDSYSKAAMERAMKMQEVILRAWFRRVMLACLVSGRRPKR